MILVDTSVWVSHFREGNAGLAALLTNGEVACHPFIIGELACGNLTNRTTILSLLKALPSTVVAEPEEILTFIENNHLMGRGLGYVDIHLLASALLTRVSLWTLDKRLEQIADLFQLQYQPEAP